MIKRRIKEKKMIHVSNQNSREPEATLQDVVDAIEKTNSTISQLGVEVEWIRVTLENQAKLIGNISESISELYLHRS